MRIQQPPVLAVVIRQANPMSVEPWTAFPPPANPARTGAPDNRAIRLDRSRPCKSTTQSKARARTAAMIARHERTSKFTEMISCRSGCPSSNSAHSDLTNHEIFASGHAVRNALTNGRAWIISPKELGLIIRRLFGWIISPCLATNGRPSHCLERTGTRRPRPILKNP